MGLTHHSLSGSVLSIGEQKSKGLRFDSSVGLDFFLCPTLVTKRKTSFSTLVLFQGLILHMGYTTMALFC